MANHKSAIKRIRSNSKKRLLNRYQHKTARNSIRDFKEINKKKEALKSFPSIVSLIDKLSKKNITDSVIDSLIGILNSCEYARYTPSSSKEMKVDYDKAVDVISNIEKS